MVCIEEIKTELQKNGIECTDEEALQIRDYLYKLAEIGIEAYQEQKQKRQRNK